RAPFRFPPSPCHRNLRRRPRVDQSLEWPYRCRHVCWRGPATAGRASGLCVAACVGASGPSAPARSGSSLLLVELRAGDFRSLTPHNAIVVGIGPPGVSRIGIENRPLEPDPLSRFLRCGGSAEALSEGGSG